MFVCVCVRVCVHAHGWLVHSSGSKLKIFEE